MTKDAELYIVRHDQCIQFKSRPPKVMMENIMATHLLQLVHLDYLMIEATEGRRDIHVLIITDHSMKYMHRPWYHHGRLLGAKPRLCWTNWLVHYGLPESIVSD